MSIPTREAILEFVRGSDGNVGKREIARAFGLHGDERDELRNLLRTMQDEGVLELGAGRTLHEGGGLPKVTVLQVVEAAGDRVIAVPARWEQATPAPRVRVMERGRKGALGIGDRVLARIEPAGSGHVAHVMKKLRSASVEVLGTAAREGAGWRLRPVDKRARHDFTLDTSDLHPEPNSGELLLCEARYLAPVQAGPWPAPGSGRGSARSCA